MQKLFSIFEHIAKTRIFFKFVTFLNLEQIWENPNIFQKMGIIFKILKRNQNDKNLKFQTFLNKNAILEFIT